MTKSRMPIGAVIKEIIKEKRIPMKEIMAKTSLSRTGIYANYSKTEMADAEIQKWAKALGVTKEEMLKRRSLSDADSGDNSNYLMEHLAGLEEQFKAFKEQLQVKDMQIASLQRMLEMTLGKSEGVIKLKTTLVRDMYPEAGALEA
ncbi:hypothetical protein LZD49_12595 [Dyadobacter sp. CY261]|uniref:hypothetical protein n=1 Tax=Dyadobacter sp. CY261 TaxID=2907203 RepID=UPI001F1DA5C3|nr:hypothetical protein [Dyadobacter sp. CY261]MCF0071312.1 hypothetical protein [Dyadobacter sp. CY261]